MFRLLEKLVVGTVALVAHIATEVEQDAEHKRAGTGPYSPEAIKAADLRKEQSDRAYKEARNKQRKSRPVGHWLPYCFPVSATKFHGGSHDAKKVAETLGIIDAYLELIDAPINDIKKLNQLDIQGSFKGEYLDFLGGSHTEVHSRNRVCKAGELTEKEAYELLSIRIRSRLGNAQFEDSWQRGKLRVTEHLEELQRCIAEWDACYDSYSDNINTSYSVQKIVGLTGDCWR